MSSVGHRGSWAAAAAARATPNNNDDDDARAIDLDIIRSLARSRSHHMVPHSPKPKLTLLVTD